MAELSDERLAEMRLCAEQVTQPGRDHPVGERLLGRDILALLDAFFRLRAENAALVAARAELVDGLRAFEPPCDTKDWPDHAELIYKEGTNAERFICTLGSMRRAAELVARHGGQPPADVDHATGS